MGSALSAPAAPGVVGYHTCRVAPVGRYGITADRVERILSEGLNWRQRNFRPDPADCGSQLGEFNPEGVYVYLDLSSTRCLWPKSHVAVFQVDLEGLSWTQDSWGGPGAVIIPEVVQPERLRLVHTYVPGERVLTRLP